MDEPVELKLKYLIDSQMKAENLLKLIHHKN
jgi:hypothetical protein